MILMYRCTKCRRIIHDKEHGYCIDGIICKKCSEKGENNGKSK